MPAMRPVGRNERKRSGRRLGDGFIRFSATVAMVMVLGEGAVGRRIHPWGNRGQLRKPVQSSTCKRTITQQSCSLRVRQMLISESSLVSALVLRVFRSSYCALCRPPCWPQRWLEYECGGDRKGLLHPLRSRAKSATRLPMAPGQWSGT